MVNHQPVHLTDAQIDHYLRKSSGKEVRAQNAWDENHLSECWHCLERAIQMQRSQLGFAHLGAPPAKAYPGCPNEDVIERVATGVYPSSQVSEVVHHAAHCDYCGPLLKRYHEESSEGLSPAEEAFLAGLKTSTPEWQQQLVRHHTGPIWRRIWRRFAERIANLPPQIWRWAPAAAVGSALVIGGIIVTPSVMDTLAQKKVMSLDAQALCEQPVLEMRIPHECYAPVQKQMGNSSGQPSESLLEAQRILVHKEKDGPLGREWLQSKGLTYLVAGTPGSASKASGAFEKARHEGLDDPSLEIELAASYFELDQVPRTIELLEGVLKRPNLSLEDREVALYDLAIAYESTQTWTLAVDRWEAYLKLDSSSDWARDAKTRLDKAKTKAKTPVSKFPSPSASPVSDDRALQAHLEEYLDNLRYWLIEAVENPKSSVAMAGRRLAEVMRDRHSDPWLEDLLHRTRRDQLLALRALSRALTANKRGWYQKAASEAQDAAVRFGQQNNIPAEMLARFEQVYASQRDLEPIDCVARARPLWNELSRTSYRWLQGQLALEKATCRNLAGNLNDAKRELALSDRIEQNSDFPVLRLRIIGLGAGIERLQNHDEESWHEAVQGLSLCSEEVCPLERLYQFYSVLEQYAQKAHLFNAQEALLRQAIAIREADSPEDRDLILEGEIYGRLSIAASHLREEALAEEALQNSNRLLNSVPNDPTANKYVLDTKADLAERQLQLGNAKAAIEILEPAAERVPHIGHEFVALKFYRFLGEGYRQLGKLDQAASSYQAAIVIAEKALSTLTDESDRLRWVRGSDPVYRGLILVLLDYGKHADALKVWEWYVSRSLRLKALPPEVSWSELQKEIFSPLPVLTPNLRIVYASFQDQLQIWIVKPNEVKANRVKVRQADLESEVTDFANQCATPPPTDKKELEKTQDELHKLARMLSSWFLEPVAQEIGSSDDIAVELDPQLARLPILALLGPDGRYFGQAHAITSSPGMFWEEKLRQPKPIGAATALLLVQGAGRLPGQADLSDTIRSAFVNTTFLTPDKAPWSAVSRELNRHEVFVFIGHGHPEGSGTDLLYGEKRIGAGEFTAELLGRLKFAALEACSSGAGGESGVLRTDNLVHAFLSGGVPSVIASRWDVDSQSTANLMASFIKHLGQNENVSQAMYEARKDNFVVSSHPYYWAGLDLVGRSD